jgi:hypothetical protein
MAEIFEFSSLRQDWYSANHEMPRLVRRSMEGRPPQAFSGFPRHWIPVFEWFGVAWSKSIDPLTHIPFFSDLSEESIVAIVNQAKQEKKLRILVESATMYDPILSDFLYILDNTATSLSAAMRSDSQEITNSSTGRRLILNGWQSYGRPSVLALENAFTAITPKAEVAAVLPCALRRPYDRSRTHKRIYRLLVETGYELNKLHRIVVTSLGVLPEELWQMPQVLAYDAGVPDIYRILRLARKYFGYFRYAQVLDCLQFEPYSDVLRIVQKEGLIGEIIKIRIPGKKHFHIRP